MTATLKVQSPNLIQPSAIRHRALDGGEHDFALGVGKAQGKHFRDELADLAGRKVDDRRYLAPEQGFGQIISGDLGGGFLDPDLGSEIDAELERGLARL